MSVSFFRSVASTNYPCFQSDNGVDKDHLWNHLWGLFTSQMWECHTDSNAHNNYILLAGMAPGPASLESKQERPSSDRQATVLLCCYHCWPYPADLTGADAMNFILKISTVHTELALLETFLIITFEFSRNLSADPDFLRHFDVIQRLLSSRPYFRTTEVSGCRTWSTQLIALQQEPAVSLKFTRLMVIHPCMPLR